MPFQCKCLWDRSAGNKEAVGDSDLMAGVGSSLTTFASMVGLVVLVTLW